MVAKINVGSSLFGALAYNQKKMDEEKGRVLCSNKMTESEDGSFNIHTCLRDFENQMPQDMKTEKPIIHISLNPHPDDKLTDEQLAAIAQEYMEKLGYGNQPYMVYKHEDISRHHIHIVSLRVDETGRKINDKFEHRRSKDITRELEQKYGLHTAEKRQQGDDWKLSKIDSAQGDVKQQIANVIKPLSRLYQFQSFTEYKALLSTYNIDVEEVKGEVRGRKYNGLVYSALNDKGEKIGNPFKSSRFGKIVGYDAIHNRIAQSSATIKDKKLKERTKGIVSAAMRMGGTRANFERELSKNNIDVLFRQNDTGRIYGVTFIDHEMRCVLNGSRLGKEFSANTFNDWFNSPHDRREEVAPATQNNESQSQDTAPFSEQPQRESENIADAALNLFSMESHGTDPEEEAFRKRMQRKKKKGRGF